MSELHEIERRLDRDRQALAGQLSALRARVSPAALIADGKDAVRHQVLPLARTVDDAVRSRPVVAALAALACATLVLGRKGPVAGTDAAPAVPALAGTRFEALTRWEDEGGPVAPDPVDPDEHWLSEARGLHARAGQLLARIDAAARLGLHPAATLARQRADVMAALTRDTRAALARGLSGLNEAARDKALQARHRIYLNRLALEAKAGAGVAAHPLRAGVVAAAAGAALASVFPSTRTEDHILGALRDQLTDELSRTLKAEAVKASELAQVLSVAFRHDLDRAAAALSAGTSARRAAAQGG